MEKLQINVGGNMEQAASRAFIDAWHRAEKGEEFTERHLVFESWKALTRVLTDKRLELLGYLRQHNVSSIRALSIALKRDYRNVHADVQALAKAGLLQKKNGLHANYARIETSITL